jgi:hypothetical protein
MKSGSGLNKAKMKVREPSLKPIGEFYERIFEPAEKYAPTLALSSVHAHRKVRA